MAQMSRLTELFVRISDSLSEEDVRHLKALVAIDKVLGKARVQHATALDILNMLLENATIGERNLGFLVEVLTSLRKQALANEAERLEQEYKMEESEHQNTNASVRDTSGPRDSAPDNSTRNFNNPEPSGRGDTSETQEIRPRRPQAAAAVQDSVGILEGQQRNALPQNGGIAFCSTGKRLIGVLFVFLFIVLVWWFMWKPVPGRYQYGQIKVAFSQGDMYRKGLNSPRESIMYYKEALALAKQLGDRHEEGKAYNKLGRAYYEMREYEEALEWYQKDLRLTQERGVKVDELIAKINIADTYYRQGKLEQAKSHYQSAMPIALEPGNEQEQKHIAKRLAKI